MSIFSMRQYLASGKPRLVVKPLTHLIQWEIVEANNRVDTGHCRTFEEIADVQREHACPVVFVDDELRPQDTAEAACHYGWYTFRGQVVTNEEDRAALAEAVPLVRASFVRAMEHELQENKAKGDWCEYTPTHAEIRRELEYHFAKFLAALVRNAGQQKDLPGTRCARVTEHAADMSNFCMKAAEIFGLEEPATL